ncbi:MAG: DNA replication/repair protein RecF [Ruminococcaceae bacterium]|nr:DNA replication/repair protein RecF [Oscillospiraceae bacterium]
MPIHSVQLENFRNFESLSCSFSPHVNLISGENAQGKTNLIEALFYFSAQKSFRAPKDEILIRRDAPFFRISETLFNGVRDFTLEVTLERGKKKHLLLNDIPQRKSSDVIGILPVVLFTPDDLYLIKAGASERRRLLDLPLCQIRPFYYETLSRYNRTLRMKRALLKEEYNEKNRTLCDAYNADMARSASEIISMRKNFCDSLTKEAKMLHESLSGGREELIIHYKTISKADPEASPRENEDKIYARLTELMHSEFEAETPLSGIHKDDLNISINDFAAKNYASQGQMRSIALSLKLAERELIEMDTGCQPVLFLDDVLSELDTGRKNFILNHIHRGQIFITCCDPITLSKETEGKQFVFHNGKITKECDF